VGDLKGIAQKLDYVQSLGANTIWLNPHYPTTTYHGYDVVDYFNVNPQLGALDDFKALTAEMKKRGMRLIVDYVANHSSNAHPFFKDAYKNPKSKYTSWYHFLDKENKQYSSFYGVENLPDWNTDNPDVVKYLIDAAQFWLDLGADGIRCDYALGVEEPFWKQLRAAVKAKHPDAVILGEVWDQNALTLNKYFGYGFDALFDFPFQLALVGDINKNGDGVLNGRDAATFLQAPLKVALRLYPQDAELARFVSNHDTNRIASEVDADPARLRLAAALNLLAPGIPEIYYGEEIGMKGSKGPGPFYDELRREPMDWCKPEACDGMTRWFKPPLRNNAPDDGVSVEEEDSDPKSLLNVYRDLAKLRAGHPALRSRSFAVVDGVAGCETACLGIWRWSADEAIFTLFNFSGQAQTAVLDADALPVAIGQNATALLGRAPAPAGVTVDPWGAAVLRWDVEK
jgi:glycosidase